MKYYLAGALSIKTASFIYALVDVGGALLKPTSPYPDGTGRSTCARYLYNSTSVLSKCRPSTRTIPSVLRLRVFSVCWRRSLLLVTFIPRLRWWPFLPTSCSLVRWILASSSERFSPPSHPVVCWFRDHLLWRVSSLRGCVSDLLLPVPKVLDLSDEHVWHHHWH